MELSNKDAEIPMPINSVYGGGVHAHGHGHHGHMTSHHHHHHHQNYNQQESSQPHSPSSSPPHHHHHCNIIPPSSLSPPHNHHQIIPSSNNNLDNDATSTRTLTSPTALNNLQDDDQQEDKVPYNNRESALKSKKGVMVKVKVRYRECLKNHAASMGGNATDGCGEFMPSGEEGTLQFLTCSVCNCHRNFHRREIENNSSGNEYHSHPPLLPPPPPHHGYNYHSAPHHLRGRKVILGGTTTTATASSGGQQGLLGYPTRGAEAGVSLIPSGSRAVGFNLPFPYYQVGPPGGTPDDHSDDQNGRSEHQIGGMMKKRFRTKFSQEQKEKMLEFAEKVGWKIQRHEEAVVQKFCQDIGVKRRVLKVWMHNNKHTLAKKNLADNVNDDNPSSFLN